MQGAKKNLNSDPKRLGSDQYLRRLLFWYFMLLAIFPFIGIAGQYLEFAEMKWEFVNPAILRNLLKYLFFGLFIIIGLFAMENARSYSRERKKEASLPLRNKLYLAFTFVGAAVASIGVTIFSSKTQVLVDLLGLIADRFSICEV